MKNLNVYLIPGCTIGTAEFEILRLSQTRTIANYVMARRIRSTRPTGAATAFRIRELTVKVHEVILLLRILSKCCLEPKVV